MSAYTLVITHKSLIQRFSRIVFKVKDDQTLISDDFVMWDLFYRYDGMPYTEASLMLLKTF